MATQYHLCFSQIDTHTKAPLWHSLAKQYTSRANISGLFPVVENVISIGDIHGDFALLETLLVDVCQVLKRIPCEYHQSMLKEHLQRKQHCSASSSEAPTNSVYAVLNGCCYEWIGKNTWVVVLGDYTDRARTDTFCYTDVKTGHRQYDGEIPHEEKHIIDFMNYTSILADQSQQGGKLIKLLGNHEFMNLDSVFDNSAYLTPLTLQDFTGSLSMRKMAFGYRGWMREKLQLCRCYAIVQIGNVLYMHAGLNSALFTALSVQNLLGLCGNKSPLNIGKENNLICNTNRLLFRCLNTPTEKWSALDRETFDHLFNYEQISVTWDRTLGSPDTPPPTDDDLNAILTNVSYNVNMQTKFVVGHCVQTYRNTVEAAPAYRFKQIISEAAPAEDDAVSGDPEPSKRSCWRSFGWAFQESEHNEETMPYGINFDVPCTDRGVYENVLLPLLSRAPGSLAKDGRVYRIDCGMSRGFDLQSDVYGEYLNQDRAKICQWLFSRLPQALLFHYNVPQKHIDPSVLLGKFMLPRKWLKQFECSCASLPSPSKLDEEPEDASVKSKPNHSLLIPAHIPKSQTALFSTPFQQFLNTHLPLR